MRGQAVDSRQEVPLSGHLTRLARRFKSPFQGHRIREGGSDAARWKRPQAGASSPRCRERQHRLARLLGRQIAREHFQQPEAANDNAPPEKEAHDR